MHIKPGLDLAVVLGGGRTLKRNGAPEGGGAESLEHEDLSLHAGVMELQLRVLHLTDVARPTVDVQQVLEMNP